MSSMDPLLAEPLPIPGLSLTGRIPPTNATISLDASATPAEFSVWPQFHNGVAAGLRIKVAATTVLTRNWILYNRSNIESASKSQSSEGASSMTQTPEALENGHAGALLAFGLLGHLRVLNKTDICDYLTQV
jgi:anaphase-promoting complex subunit 1